MSLTRIISPGAADSSDCSHPLRYDYWQLYKNDRTMSVINLIEVASYRAAMKLSNYS